MLPLSQVYHTNIRELLTNMKHHIRIIAPSSSLPAYPESEAKLTEIITFLESNEFEVSVSEGIFANPPLPFNANTREIRFEHLQKALKDPGIDIIWAFRGGNGAAEIAVPAIEITPVGSKILIGFSDITTLHLLFNQHYNLPSIHGPVLTSLLDKHPHRIETIKDILARNKQSVKLMPKNDAATVSPPIKGEITGGNLTVYTHSTGTVLDPNTHGKILLIEDTGEAGYKLRRGLTHLEQSGKITNLAACILGDFTGGDDKIEWALNDFIIRNPSLPIFRLEGAGHGDENIPLVFGVEATIISSILEYSL